MVKFTKDSKEPIIEIYTDGACRSSATQKGSSVGKNDLSAFGYLLRYGGHEKLGGSADLGKTNNHMELKAVVEALKQLKKFNIPIVIYSDSEYIVNSINKNWMQGWKRRNWKKSDKKPPANVDLWIELDSILSQIPFFEIHHVKGHSGIEGNEIVDKYINELMDNYYE